LIADSSGIPVAVVAWTKMDLRAEVNKRSLRFKSGREFPAQLFGTYAAVQ